MSIDLDAEGKVQLRKLLGKRLRAARKAAGLTEMDACRVIGHKEQTQVSLWENGERMPTILSVISLAKAYAVPLDWLFGITDDAIADPLETNQGVIVSAISRNMWGSFNTFVSLVSQQAAVTIEGYSTDRRELKEMCEMSREALVSLKRIAELNPSFEEDMRGSATLTHVLHKMAGKGDEFGRRIESERLQTEVIDREIKFADMHEGVAQYAMLFTQ